MKDSIFEVKKSAIPTKKFPLTLPASVLDEIDEVRTMLEAKAPDMNFNVNAICLDAIQKAVRKAKKELTQMEPKRTPTISTPAQG